MFLTRLGRRQLIHQLIWVPIVKHTLAGGIWKDGKLEEASALLRRSVQDGTLRAATLTVRSSRQEFRATFGEAVQPETIFLLASITKPITATGIMLLVDRGELELSDPVHRFLPEFKGGQRSLVTIRHLLTHTSGLPDQLPENVDLRKRQAPLDEFVQAAIQTPLLFQPGTRLKYQSMGFLLASEIARRITNTPFPEFLRKEVFQPLSMERTSLGMGDFEIEATAQNQIEKAPGIYGGGQDTSSWNWNSKYWRNLGVPWGGAHSTGPDVERFLWSFLQPEKNVLRPATVSKMITNRNTHLEEPWGLGFMVESAGFGGACSPETFGHTGSTGTIAWADPQRQLSCVLLTTLPARVSRDLLLEPVSNLVAGSVDPV